MEPQMIDHYNEMPSGVNVIDKLNEENDELQKENEKLRKFNKLREFKEKHDQTMKKFQMPRIKVDKLEEYTEIEKKIDALGEFIDGMDYIEQKNKSDIIINKLDELTNHQNKDWCEYRVFITIWDQPWIEGSPDYGVDWFMEPLAHRTWSVTGNLLYYEDVCALYIPEWSNRDYHLDLWTMCYYHCEKCNKLSDSRSPFISNQLLCIDCQD